MFVSPGGSPPSSVAQLTRDVDELLAADLSRLDSDQLLALLTDLESQVRRLAVVDHALVAEVDARGLAHERGCRNTEALMRQVLRVGAGEARARVAAARDLGPRRGLTGDVLPPLFGQVAAAQRAGALSPTHARIVTSTVDRLPAAVAADHDVAVEEFLVEQARTFAPEQLAKIAQRLVNTLDPDGVLADERYRERLRDLSVRVRSDGSARVDGELTAACTEALLTVLDATAKPAPAADGTRDPRSPGQRRHDGLLDGLLTVLRTDQLPQANGVSTTLLLTMTADQLQRHLDGQPGGFARTGHGGTVSLTQALQLAADARVVPVVFGRAKEVAAYGTGHRIFTEAQRLAMIARDQGCSFPGCDVPALWCQAHHAPEHAVTGRTTISEGTLVCGFHHREHERLGWRAVMDDGVPSWVPPPWLDPDQVPRRNPMHEPAIDADLAHQPVLAPS
jgi:Domain of unknown function (DUF222)